MADAVRRRMAHHANAAVGRRVLLVRLAEEERLAVPLLVEADADAAGEENELGAEPGRPPCRERRAADTMMSIDYVAMKESRGRDRPTVRRLVFGRYDFVPPAVLTRACYFCVRKRQKYCKSHLKMDVSSLERSRFLFRAIVMHCLPPLHAWIR